jgi:hypothetical protein
VQPAREPVLGRTAVEEAARPEHHGEADRREPGGESAAPAQRGRERLQPGAPARRHAQREQDHVLREHRELEVQLLGPDREGEVNGEDRDRDGKRRGHHHPPAKRPRQWRTRLRPQHAQEHVGEAEGEQRFEEPRGTGRQLPDLLAHERPKRARTVVVLAVGDVLEHGAHQQRVRDERDAESQEAVAHEAARTLAVE